MLSPHLLRPALLIPNQIQVWRVHLDKVDRVDKVDTADKVKLPPPTPAELARAAQFQTATLRRRYLCAHTALRGILGLYTGQFTSQSSGQFTGAPLEFAIHEKGKLYLPQFPQVQFNLSRSQGMALVAVALNIPVGVDIERIRPLAERAAIAQRYFPPSESTPTNTPEFFRRWTRYEAVLKAQGLGLYGAGVELESGWMVQQIDAGPGFAAAVAAAGAGLTVVIHDYGETE